MNQSRIGPLRKSRGWTQERLAQESGIAVRTIQRLEAGQDAGLETLSRIAHALRVSVKDLFVTVESDDFHTAVESLDARTRAQQARRDHSTRSFEFLYQGVGILVTIATIVLVLTGTLSWLGWFVIPLYWAVVGYLLRFLQHLAIEPWLDAKYPLSLPSRRTIGSGPTGL